MASGKHLIVAAATAALLGAVPFGVFAQTTPDSRQPAAESQAGMMGAQGMMGGMPMMNTMNMMNMMQMMGGGDAPGVGMIDHIEGRIAFLRTELKITAAQAAVWDEFAASLRANARTLGTARSTMMSQMIRGGQRTQTLAQRLDAQERWLAARLEGTRTLKAAFEKLSGVLSDDQKKTADELLAPNMGMMAMMPMGQMMGSAR